MRTAVVARRWRSYWRRRRVRYGSSVVWLPTFPLELAALALASTGGLLLRRRAAVAPGASLTFDTVSLPVDLEDKLRDGDVDIAIDWLPVASDPSVNGTLFEDRLVLVARSDHPSVGHDLTIKELLKMEFVTPHRRGEIERLPQAISELYKLGWNVAVIVSELLEIPTVVASTDLLGIFPASRVRSWRSGSGCGY